MLTNLCLACKAQIMGRMQTNQSKQAAYPVCAWLGQTSWLQPKFTPPGGKQDPKQTGYLLAECVRTLHKRINTMEYFNHCLVSYGRKKVCYLASKEFVSSRCSGRQPQGCFSRTLLRDAVQEVCQWAGLG